jgi:probable rRNA maturation factor
MQARDEHKVRFHYQEVSFGFGHRRLLKQFILKIFKKEGRPVSGLDYIFCTDAYLLQMNETYLGHDTYTDIITFDLAGPGEPALAEIYISIDRVKENAVLFKASFKLELLRVIFHGALHLCGYKDKSKKDIRQMRKREDYYLALFVPRGTAPPKD